MTGANRVSNLYASVAEAGDDDPDVDPRRPGGAGPARTVAPDMRQPAGGAAGVRDGAASRAVRGVKGSEPAVSAKANPRRRSAAAAQAAPRKVLLRRAALAGVAIVLLAFALIVSEEKSPAPAAARVPSASTADAASESGAGGEPAPTASPLEVVARVSTEGGADGRPSVALAPEPEAAAASDDAAAQPEAGQAGAPRASDPHGPAHEIALQAVTSPAGTSQAETPLVGGKEFGAAQPETAPPRAAQGTIAPAAPATAAAAAPPLISAAAAPPPASARELARGYVVQLGVFGDPGNAEVLSRELAAQGYPAHLQSRVVLGPFPDRQAAKAAAERLRGERKLEGLVVPPRKP